MKLLTTLALALFLSLFVSCKNYQPPPDPLGGEWTWERVCQKPWRLVELEGQASLPGSGITLALAEDGSLSGTGGVNQYFGGYAREGESGLSVSEVGSTRMAGPENLMRQESRYLTRLQAIDSWRMVSDMLQLRQEGRVVLAFVPSSPRP